MSSAFRRRWLAELRRKRKLSYGRMGELCGVSPSALFYWETGKRSPRLESLKRLARALGVGVDTFLMP